ncbi:sel1 repeat family protein [Oceanisphaera sp. DM8]|uniref:Sel1 repeat family protein n=2 Tax=Oceanisphaera pacifica TaxID=2818389 RepID=A0ABS3NFI3_9GAMM|nr:sel1 repeat family protein [Oceanisphaera pacifica]
MAAERSELADTAVSDANVASDSQNTGSQKAQANSPQSTQPNSKPDRENDELTNALQLAQSEVEEGELRAIPLYEEYQLIEWINANHHLKQVRDIDNCQLVQDIEARAEVLRLPAYQFLWGDMLAWGVCVPQQPRRGLTMLWKAAEQGLPAALEQLGRYYYNGTLVQKNRQRAAPLMQEAASLGLEKAQFAWARWLLAGSGSPLDYPQAYLWLKKMVLADKAQHQEAEKLSAALASKMPASKVKQLNNQLLF